MEERRGGVLSGPAKGKLLAYVRAQLSVYMVCKVVIVLRWCHKTEHVVWFATLG